MLALLCGQGIEEISRCPVAGVFALGDVEVVAPAFHIHGRLHRLKLGGRWLVAAAKLLKSLGE
jgi:hypothetical protein